jgi:hypothetical protein
MEEKIELYGKKIETLRGGSSSTQSTESLDATIGLSKSLSELNLKGVKIEKMKKTKSAQNEKIQDKDRVIGEYQKLKFKMLIDMEKMKNTLSGKPYLVGARHIIWDEIISDIVKI